MSSDQKIAKFNPSSWIFMRFHV